jgi:hypothetical protein
MNKSYACLLLISDIFCNNARSHQKEEQPLISKDKAFMEASNIPLDFLVHLLTFWSLRKTLYFLCGYILPQSTLRNYARLTGSFGQAKDSKSAKGIYIALTDFNPLHKLNAF